MTTREEALKHLSALQAYVEGLPEGQPPPPSPIGRVIDHEVRIGSTQVLLGDVTLLDGARFVFEDVPQTHNNARLVFTGSVTREGSAPIVFVSENPNGYRGDTMVMPSAHVYLPKSNFEFIDMGRTRKDVPLNAETNPPGRYAWHFHRCGFKTKHVLGHANFVRSRSWSCVVHSSWAEIIDCQSQDGFAADFVAEAGDAIGVFQRCISSNCDGPELSMVHPTGNHTAIIEAMQFDGHVARLGHGFWRDNPEFKIVDCEVYNSKSQPFFDFAFAYEEFDTGERPVTLGIVRAKRMGATRGNYSDDCGGHELWHNTNGENRVVDTDCFDCTDSVVSGRFTANQSFEGLHAFARDGLPPDTVGVNLGGPYGANSRFSNSNSRRARLENWPIALSLPNIKASSATGVDFVDNGVDIAIDRCGDDIDANVLTFEDVGNPKFLLRNYLTYAVPQFIYTQTQRIWFDNGQIFWPEQHPDYVLWKDEGYPEWLRGRTNRELYDDFGIAPNGFLVPEGAVDRGSHFFAESAPEVPLMQRSLLPGVTSLPGQEKRGIIPTGDRRLAFRFLGVERDEKITVKSGWNKFEFEYDGVKTALFLQGI